MRVIASKCGSSINALSSISNCRYNFESICNLLAFNVLWHLRKNGHRANSKKNGIKNFHFFDGKFKNSFLNFLKTVRAPEPLRAESPGLIQPNVKRWVRLKKIFGDEFYLPKVSRWAEINEPFRLFSTSYINLQDI